MTHPDGTPIIRAEVAILGAGTAGCVIAARLVEAGKDVILIEAGPDYGPRSNPEWPSDLLDAKSLPTSHDWGYHGSGAGGQALALDRARVIGGCSTHNGCTQTVGWGADYDEWAANGCPGWESSTLRPLCAAAAKKMSFHSWSAAEIQPFHRAFLDGCATAGVARRDDIDDLDGGEGAGCAPVNIQNNIRINTAFAYLDSLRNQAGLRILSNATVDRVIVERGRAHAVVVVVDGQRMRVEAEEIVVSCGAYGSPEVLLRSGIGPANDLRGVGVKVVHDLPGVGENLHDQPAAQLEYSLTESFGQALEAFGAQREIQEEQALAKLQSPYSDGPYDLHVYPWVERDASIPGGWRCVIPVAPLRPRSRGTVRLRSANPDERAIIDTGFFTDRGGIDLAAVKFGIEWVEQKLLKTDFGLALDHELSDRDWRQSDPDEWIRNTHQHYWHPAGSCKMGPRWDPLAVVDHAGRVHGIAGLRVADASIFPTIPRGTPAFPTVIVAERIAQMMISAQQH